MISTKRLQRKIEIMCLKVQPLVSLAYLLYHPFPVVRVFLMAAVVQKSRPKRQVFFNAKEIRESSMMSLYHELACARECLVR